MGKRKQDCASRPEKGQNTKQWNPEFSENRPFADRPFLEVLKLFDNKRGSVAALLQDFQSSVPSLQVERVKAFFAHAETASAPILPLERAWVDNRRKINGQSLCRPTWMTSAEVAEVLKQQWLSLTSHTEVNRLLIHVLYLTPDYAHTLIQTVSQNNVGALRAALRGHIARETALRVFIPIEGFLTFRLELHLPYLTLRGSRKAPTTPNSKGDMRNKSPWCDLSFLRLALSSDGLANEHAIYDAHITIVISGWDKFKYSGYAFLDPGSVEHHFQEENDDDDDADDEGEDDNEDLDDEPEEDQFATEGWDRFLNADVTIVDPRVYFLRAVQIRTALALQEYDYLVGHFQEVVDDWMVKQLYRPSTVPPRPNQTQRPLSDEELFETITRITQLLRKVRAYLSETNRAWRKFSGPYGDIAYFIDLSDRTAAEARDRIRDAFEDLAGLEEKLILMEESCKESAKTLEYRIGVKNNALNHDNNSLTRRVLNLNLDTSKLSKRTTEIAYESQKATIETTRLTRVSVYLVLATTPFIITLQYFTSDRKLFAFDRNPRTFFISIGILMPLLFALALILYGLDSIKGILFWKIIESMGGKRPRKGIAYSIDAEIDSSLAP